VQSFHNGCIEIWLVEKTNNRNTCTLQSSFVQLVKFLRYQSIAVAKAMRVIAPFDSAQGAMTLIALTALAVAIAEI